MENHRLILYFTLFFVVYLLWAQWQMDYGPKPVAPVAITNESGGQIIDPDTAVPDAAVGPQDIITIAEDNVVASQRINIVTDVLDLEIDTRGGDVVKATLRNYAVKAEAPEIKLNLLTDADINFHIAQSGLVSVNKESAPTHKAVYTLDKTIYRLAEGESEIVVPLQWQGAGGVRVSKIYTFKRGEYTIDVEHKVNAGAEDWSGSQYTQLVRTQPSEEGKSAFIHTYTGGVIYNDEIKYEKYDFDDIVDNNLNRELKDGWLAMIQHYFLAAWIPETGADNLYYSRYNNNKGTYLLGTRSPAIAIKAGEEKSFKTRLVAGPKLQNKLEEIAPGLELTVDYGVLTIIAKPLFWLLNLFHSWFGNWGWAIIFLTITVKAIFYKLSEMSYRSMAKMRKVAPRIKQMKEQYGDDRQAMSRSMMEMYKREKINPMGGCFPILVQIPVFISLYWVLLESVEMRHAPFALWLDNLSAKDPYFVLPVIMGVSMFIQQKLNPAPIDPIQQKVFQIMPFAFTIMFAFFPSGLVLYWVVNNLLSITQQWIITKRIEAE